MNFLMDVTHCNIGPRLGKFWMLPIITSDPESAISIGTVLVIFSFIFAHNSKTIRSIFVKLWEIATNNMTVTNLQ